MDEIISRYLNEHLAIRIKEETRGFNGRCVVVELLLDSQVISSDSYTIKQDDD
jgi:hypothetical protein